MLSRLSRRLLTATIVLVQRDSRGFLAGTSLTRAIGNLLWFVQRFKTKEGSFDSKEESAGTGKLSNLERAKRVILRETQKEAFPKEIRNLQNSKPIPKDSHISSLSPYLDEERILRVGGRLNKSGYNSLEKNPVILPGKHHTAKLIVLHFYAKVHHQGRHLTAGAVRSAGFWITGSKRLISSLIHKCVRCRRLRGKTAVQLMADLPADRLTPSPPFTYVEVDIFGPWYISFRRTRGSHSQQKRWAALFTCLVIRAVHIEVIEDMSSSSFINALRRFYSIRGPVSVFRSDRGTNFVGSTDAVRIQAINVEDKEMSNHLVNIGTVWRFNPPHASHMGEIWERMNSTTRRILDSMLLDVKGKELTHEVLATLMAEVTAIINSRPIVAVSTDPEDPRVLSPSVLLTQKSLELPTCQLTNVNLKDSYRIQWKQVQNLANNFWDRWKKSVLCRFAGEA